MSYGTGHHGSISNMSLFAPEGRRNSRMHMLPYDYWLNGEPGRPNKVGAEGSVGTHTHTHLAIHSTHRRHLLDTIRTVQK